MTQQIVLFGTGDIARIAHFYFTHDSDYEVAAFTVDQAYMQGDRFLDLPVVPFEQVQQHYPPDRYPMFVALSYAKLNKVRAEKYYQAKEKGYTLVNYISSRATVWPGLKIGDNCFVLEDNTLQPFITIGSNVTLWSGNHIGHDAVIEDHCFISSHVVISGYVRVKPYCFLGVNATFRNNITVERENIIGAGAVIMHDTEPEAVYKPPKAQKFQLPSSQVEL